VLQWLMFQMGNIGPMMGQTHHFRHYAPEKIPYAVERYTNEAGRLYRVVEKRLSESPWLGGEEYSIADIAAFPWLRNPERKGQDSADFPKTTAWMETIEARPAVERALQVLAEHQSTGKFDATARENLFGAKQFGRH
jgi:GST-like protein